MPHFECHFEHWPEYRVIFCKTCRFCPVPSQITRHLRDHHGHVSAAIQRQIVEAVQQIPDLAQQPGQVRYPDPDTPPIPELGVIENAFRCTAPRNNATEGGCGYMCLNIKSMQRHCKEQHGWINVQKRGRMGRGGRDTRQPQTPNRIWVDGCFGQQFFRVDKWKKIFPVAAPESARVTVDEIVQRAERQLAAQQKAIEEFRQHEVMGHQENRYEVNGWLERAGWASHLARYTRDELEHFVAIPRRKEEVTEEVTEESENEDDTQVDRSSSSSTKSSAFPRVEVELWRACQSTIRVIQAAQKSSHPDVVGLAALQYVNRRETGQKNSEKPFYGRQMGKTIRKYSQHWVRILCYVWRTHDDVEPPPPYKLTDRQRRCFQALQESVQSPVPTTDRRTPADLQTL
ncbi:hypothetical protein A1O1_06669 [Capronia coronata CBS 617.96]|uniref:C2H2-type domain-containing protein n=1 Tax=Capronia coronata CBS 617.96 TaxID=1182541 RepID=W9YVJ6_9EURO|nr:uncharacterized protein A1O1_06669 [Capronia coronata CBS 617.96]EXJ86299.1 hypothetical protein A1O1_06669 [Capronia coronata CBS 617.96]